MQKVFFNACYFIIKKYLLRPKVCHCQKITKNKIYENNNRLNKLFPKKKMWKYLYWFCFKDLKVFYKAFEIGIENDDG